MQRIVQLIVISSAFAAFQAIAESGTEAQQIAVLQSSAEDSVKSDACRRLKQIGTTKAVPVLARLLADEHLSQAACDALETMPFEQAGEALRDSLGSTSSKFKAGIIHALGERHEIRALPELGRLLADPDPLLASECARA